MMFLWYICTVVQIVQYAQVFLTTLCTYRSISRVDTIKTLYNGDDVVSQNQNSLIYWVRILLKTSTLTKAWSPRSVTWWIWVTYVSSLVISTVVYSRYELTGFGNNERTRYVFFVWTHKTWPRCGQDMGPQILGSIVGHLGSFNVWEVQLYFPRPWEVQLYFKYI